MATQGEQAAARLVERLEQLEAAFDRLIDTAKAAYHACWEDMSSEERAEFVEVLGLSSQKELQNFILTRGEELRAAFLPAWMLVD